MKLKLDDAGHVVVSDGKPVYLADDGKEIAFDVVGTHATITRLNAEAKGHREAKEAAEGRLKTFEGISDPAAARKALEIVQNLDHKKLVDAGEVDKVKAEAIKAVEEKYAPVVLERDKLKGELFGEKIGGSFARSKFIAEKTILPGAAAQKVFGEHFKIEDGKIAAYDTSGNKVFSRARPGEAAEFDEAIEILVDQYPYKDNILRGTGGSGGGKPPGSGGSGGGKDLSGLSPVERINAARAGR